MTAGSRKDVFDVNVAGSDRLARGHGGNPA
jgi:hypothetical protein